MRFARSLSLSVFLSCFHAFIMHSQGQPPLEELVQRIKVSVAEAGNNLIDFTCKEKITSSRLDKGKVSNQKTVESNFTVGREAAQKGKVVHKESRDVLRIDGKLVRQGTKIPKMPIFFDGMGAGLPTFTFGASDGHDFLVKTYAVLPDNPTLILTFTAKPGHPGNQVKGNDKLSSFITDGSLGEAQIDMKTMRILRLERRSPPAAAPAIEIEAEYSVFTIDGKEYSVPSKVVGQLTPSAKDKTRKSLFVAEYTDCRKFDVTTQIKFR